MGLHVPGTVRVALDTFCVHAYHWYVNLGAGYPAHVPFRTVKVLPTLAVPASVGFVVAAARISTLVLVLADSHDTGSIPALVAVTLTVMYLPLRADVSVKVVCVAPLMVAQVPGTVRVALDTFRVHAYH